MTKVHTHSTTTHDGGVITTVTFDNERRLNAMNPDGAALLTEAIRQAGKDPDLRVMVLRGQGERALIGGADIYHMLEVEPDDAEAFISSIHHVCDAIRRVPVPVVARVRGYCLGAGLEVAAACDMRIGDASAVLGMPEVAVGLPSVIEAALLPRLMGWGRASYLIYSGQNLNAEQALSWGLLERVAADGELDAVMDELTALMASHAPQTMRLQKELMRDWEELSLRDAIQRGVEIMPRAFATGESKPRMRAFIDRER